MCITSDAQAIVNLPLTNAQLAPEQLEHSEMNTQPLHNSPSAWCRLV